MSFEYVDTNAKAGDGGNQLLTKILQRLNWNASVTPDVPSANVVVTNTPLQVRDAPALAVLIAMDAHLGNLDTDTTQILIELQAIHIHATSIDGKLTSTNALLTTIDADTSNLGGIKTDTALIAARLTTPGASAAALLEQINNDTTLIAARLINAGSSAAFLLESINTYTVAVADGVYIRDYDSGQRAVVTDDGHLSTVSTPFAFEISHSGYYGNRLARSFKILGRRAGFNSTTILQDVGEWLSTSINLLPELAGTEALEVVSSDVADDNTPGGTGTRTIRIVYLDTSYAIQVLDVALNGATPVGLGAVRMLHVYWMEALTGGASEISVGNIDLRTVAGAIIQERISAGGNKSLSSRFMVPDNYEAYLSEWEVSTIGASQDARLRATVSTDDRALCARYIFQDTFMTAADGSSLKVEPWLRFPPRCRLKVSTLAGATAAINKLSASFVISIVEL